MTLFCLLFCATVSAPILIGNKFDFVVGNPPWIAWKSMSKSYREGTLEIWKSYGIFEKNAYMIRRQPTMILEWL